MANPAHALDGAILRPFHFGRHWPAASDVHRYPIEWVTKFEVKRTESGGWISKRVDYIIRTKHCDKAKTSRSECKRRIHTTCGLRVAPELHKHQVNRRR